MVCRSNADQMISLSHDVFCVSQQLGLVHDFAVHETIDTGLSHLNDYVYFTHTSRIYTFNTQAFNVQTDTHTSMYI